MQILLENGSYSLDNLGDVAMLQVAAQRVANLWPGSAVMAVTIHPKRLERHLPGVEPTAPSGLPPWSLPLVRAGSNLPSGVRSTLSGVLANSWSISGVPRLRGGGESLDPVDLVLMAGSGIFANPFKGPALRRLETLAAAQRTGVPFALMSQGLGPIDERSLHERASEVFPHAGLIALRERLHGPGLLQSMRMPEDRILFTGDDSLELALKSHRPDAPREALGFNLRIASHSGLPEASAAELGHIFENVKAFADTEAAALQPLSVHRSDHPRMLRALPELRQNHLGQMHQHTVEALIQAISSCRLVVTGSYHAAVLALGQGIPALCLANNRYYRLKFNGLADQFPEGCLVINLAQTGAAAQVNHGLEDLWDRADGAHDNLVAAAEAQVKRSREVYLRLEEIV